MPWAAASLILGLLTWTGCSAVVDPDTRDLGSPPPVPCVPGTVVQCACIGGTGTQTCTLQERFDVCLCTSPAGAAGTGGN